MGFLDRFECGLSGDYRYEIVGKTVVCSHCGGEESDERSGQLSTACASLLALYGATRLSVRLCAKAAVMRNDFFKKSVDPESVNLTPADLADERLSCVICVGRPHPGVEAKRQWFADRLRKGHVSRKFQLEAQAFIEYASLETARVPVLGATICTRAFGRTARQGEGVRSCAYGVLPGRCAGARRVGCVSSGREEAEGVVDRLGVCAEVRLRGGERAGRRVP